MPKDINHLEYFASEQWTTVLWSTNYKITFSKIIFDTIAGVSMNLKQDRMHGLPVWGWIICTKCFQVMFPMKNQLFLSLLPIILCQQYVEMAVFVDEHGSLIVVV